MSLNKLFSKLKGGPRSGNWGHAGRPGKKGGSSPGGGFGRIGVSNPKDREEILQAASKYKTLSKIPKGKKLDTKDPSKTNKVKYNTPYEELSDGLGGKEFLGYVNGLSSYEDGDLIFAQLRVREFGPGEFILSGELKDKNNLSFFNAEGIIKRRFDFNKGVVENEMLQISPKFLGNGFGTKFYKASEEAYKEMGLKQVDILANIDVGGYAWARMGYDFRDSDAKRTIQDRFKSTYRKRYGTDPSKIPEKPWEIASTVGPDGHKIGKEALLRSAWKGKKILDENDEGWKIGQAYYEAKIK